MSKKIMTILIVAMIATLLVHSFAFAADVSLTLSSGTASPMDDVTASGIAEPDTWVSIKVLGSTKEIVVFDAVKSDAQGNYSLTFKVPESSKNTLTVVAGYGTNVAKQTLTITNGGSSDDTTAPAWPAGTALTPSGIDKTSLTLTWTSATDNVGVTSYEIFKNGSPYTTVDSNTLTCKVTGLSPGSSYNFQIVATDAAGNRSTTGPSITVTTDASSSGGGGGGGGGSGTSTPQAVNSTTGEATVAPNAGGTISQGSDASINIPAGALNGTTPVNVSIQKVSIPPSAPSDSRLLGSVFEFTVGGNASYHFTKPVTLTLTFDPDSLATGETPSIYYYDVASSQWVKLGGSISGNKITVTTDHFTQFAVLAKEASEKAPAQRYSDVRTSHWANDVINKLSAQGYISGYPDGTFKPNNNITRAEFATVLVKAYKLPVSAGKAFDDTTNHWARDYITTAYDAGIAAGYNEHSFGPEDLITREQMAVMIAKAATIEVIAAEIPFKDSGETSAWARDALTAVAQKGIMQGYPDGTFNPRQNATRAEATMVIANALK